MVMDILASELDSDAYTTIVENEDCAFKVMKMSDSKYTLHIDVHNWSKATLRWMLEAWPDVLNEFSAAGVDTLYALVPKKREDTSGKFAVMFGMAPHKAYDFTFEDGTVETFWVYKILTSPEGYV